MTAKIRLIETVVVQAGEERMIECVLDQAGVTITISTSDWGFPPGSRSVRSLAWDQVSDLDFVSKLFDLETVLVFRVVAQLLGQAENLKSCL
jgi:hypothetical protein